MPEEKEKEKRATIYSQKGLTEVPLKIFQTRIVSSEREVRKDEKKGAISFFALSTLPFAFVKLKKEFDECNKWCY